MDLESFREHKLARLHNVLARPGMWASTAESMCATMQPLLEDLALLHDQPTSGELWTVVSNERYGEYGLPGLSWWFTAPEQRGVEETAAQFAQLASRLGFLDVADRVAPDDWVAWGLDMAVVYRTRDWTRADLPRPSLVVGNRVWCYAPIDPMAEWVYLDFPRWDGNDDHDQLLRDVRLPRERAVHGLVFTPFGRQFDDRWTGELHADIDFLTDVQARAVAVAAVELVLARHPVDDPAIATALTALRTGTDPAPARDELAQLEARVRASRDPSSTSLHGPLSTVLVARHALADDPRAAAIEAVCSAYFTLVDASPESVVTLRRMVLEPDV